MPLTASSKTDCKEQPLLFQDLGSRQVVADFLGGTLSSNGGVLLLREVDANLGLTQSLAQCFADHRQQVFVDHAVQEMLAQRIFGLARICHSSRDLSRRGEFTEAKAALVAPFFLDFG